MNKTKTRIRAESNQNLCQKLKTSDLTQKKNISPNLSDQRNYTSQKKFRNIRHCKKKKTQVDRDTKEMYKLVEYFQIKLT